MIDRTIEDPRLLAAFREVLALVEGEEGVAGVDVGFTNDKGHPAEEPSVHVYITGEERAWSDFALKVPESIEGVRISLVRARDPVPGVGLHPLEEKRRRRVNPLQPGVSVANRRRAGGTLGLIVDHSAKGRCILSCAHVLIADTTGTRGRIVQPASGGGDAWIGDAADFIYGNEGDAAIAVLNGSRGTNPAQLETNVVIQTVRWPRMGEVLTKSGVGTFVTCGRVIRVGNYLLPTGETQLLPGARTLKTHGMYGFRIGPVRPREPLSAAGDSGSVWYADDDHAGVGLHVSGTLMEGDFEGYATACYLSVVLEQLSVTPATTGS
jgi:endonuclease G